MIAVRRELVADRLVDGLGQARELADIQVDPAVQVVVGLARHQQHLGRDHAGLGHQPAARLCHHVGDVAETLAHQFHHARGVGRGALDRLAVIGGKATADVEQAQLVPRIARGVPDGRHLVERRGPHLGPLGLGADVEGQPHRVEPEIARHVEQRERLVTGAAELARQRPVGLGRVDDQADIDLCAGRVLGDLFKLLLGIGGKEGHARMPGELDVAHLLDGVAERDVLGPRAQAQAELDLCAGGCVEARSEVHETLDDLTLGVGLDGVVDARLAETGLEGAVLLFHAIDVEHERRAVELLATDVVFDAGCTRNSGARREIGYVSVHGHLQ